MPLNVRTALPTDDQAILALLHEMHGEIGIFPLSEARLIERVKELLTEGLVIVVENENMMVGTIGLYGGCLWYSDQKVLMDSWVFTSNRAKDRLSVFRLLVKEAKETALDLGLPLILKLYFEVQKDKKHALFQRYGDMIMQGFQFVPVGGDFKVR